MLSKRLEDKSGPLGLSFVGKYDEKRIPKYPAAIIVPGPLEKNLHAEHTFNLSYTVDIYVYHGLLSLTKRERSKADLQLVANIETELERDYEWLRDPGDPQTKQIVFGYVSAQRPGAYQPASNKSTIIIGTRMTWVALSQRRF